MSGFIFAQLASITERILCNLYKAVHLNAQQEQEKKKKEHKNNKKTMNLKQKLVIPRMLKDLLSSNILKNCLPRCLRFLLTALMGSPKGPSFLALAVVLLLSSLICFRV